MNPLFPTATPTAPATSARTGLADLNPLPPTAWPVPPDAQPRVGRAGTAIPITPVLPRRPRLLVAGPAVWRRPGDLQIGLGSPCLLLRDVPEQVAAAVPLLDGFHSVHEVAALVGPGWADWLLAALDRLDALTDGPPPPDRRRVGVVGQGPLADAVAARLDAHGFRLDARRPDVVVVAPATVEADRVEVARLAAQGTPHLVARHGHGQATLGPFVWPGATSCLNCLDLGRRQADAAWPLMVFQLARIEPPRDELLIDWLAAGVSAQLAAWSAGRLPETASATHCFDRWEGASSWVAWPVQPECGCAVGRA